ncbi:hypothetical protein NLM33_46300 [Bradyrhizobium sp. CCGUVB1N3]|uniref:hypothetical protein n=1 Tax=Bradyrhizobium sp. CCGUVB1N3 TaxID=2949629 RepID=UPI0020B28824|nr:hypothetical protein [Bradyrhizobium sp. CCGUVB1N3]MCP3477573.1 hypothetical protein [Bradyrhizobium sp. CCGUVB1N3]
MGILAVLASYFLIWPVWRAQFPIEIWFTESWNAFHQDAAAAGLGLYPGADQLIVNNYPPLSFFVVGGLGKLFGDSLFVGRALSIIGLLAIAVEIVLAVRMLAGSLLAGAVGAMWFVAIMAHNATRYVGANDPQIAGQAIMGAALVWFLHRDKAKASPLPPLLLMVLAGFWKHNIIAIPATAILWLCFHDWRSAARPVLISVGAVVLGLGACGAIFGSAFFANLLTARAYSLGHLVSQIGHLQWLALAAVMWGIWAWFDRASYAARFTALHTAVALLSCLTQWLGDGVFGTAAFDLTIALAIGTGAALARIAASPAAVAIGLNRARVAVVVALALRLVLSGRQESAQVLLDPQFRARYAASAEIMATAAASVSRIPGPVYCKLNNLVCRAAGKAFVVDDFKTDQFLATGKATEADIAAMLQSRGITVIESSALLVAAGPQSAILKSP